MKFEGCNEINFKILPFTLIDHALRIEAAHEISVE